MSTLSGIYDLSLSGEQILVSLLNTKKNTNYSTDAFLIGDPQLPSNNSTGRNTVIRMTGTTSGGIYGSFDLFYNRLDISTLGAISVANPGVTNLVGLIEQINIVKGIKLVPADIVDDVIGNNLQISPTCKLFYGNAVLSIIGAPTQAPTMTPTASPTSTPTGAPSPPTGEQPLALNGTGIATIGVDKVEIITQPADAGILINVEFINLASLTNHNVIFNLDRFDSVGNIVSTTVVDSAYRRADVNGSISFVFTITLADNVSSARYQVHGSATRYINGILVTVTNSTIVKIYTTVPISTPAPTPGPVLRYQYSAGGYDFKDTPLEACQLAVAGETSLDPGHPITLTGVDVDNLLCNISIYYPVGPPQISHFELENVLYTPTAAPTPPPTSAPTLAPTVAPTDAPTPPPTSAPVLQVLDDPYFINVALLLHFNEIDGSVVPIDSSPRPKNVSSFGNCFVTTGNSKFGSGSISANPGQFLSVTPSDDFTFSQILDFTMECYIFPTVLIGRPIFLGNGAVGIAQMYITSSGQFGVETSNSLGGASAPGSIVTNAWQHIAVCRSNSTVRLFVDGVQVYTYIDNRPFNTPTTIYINQYGGGGYAMTGFIDEVRITKNIARYTSNFSVPTKAFTDQKISLNNIAYLFNDNVNGIDFDPNDLSTLFKDYARTIPVTSVGDVIKGILDKSGRGNHASTIGSTDNITLGQDENGKNVFLFGSPHSYFTTDSVLDFKNSTAVTTSVGLHNQPNTPNTVFICLGRGPSYSDNSFQYGVINNSTFGAMTDITDTGGYFVGNDAIAIRDVKQVSTVVFNKAPPTSPEQFTLRTNGIEKSKASMSGVGNTYTSSFSSILPLSIGDLQNSPLTCYTGKMYRIVVIGKSLNYLEFSSVENAVNFNMGVPFPKETYLLNSATGNINLGGIEIPPLLSGSTVFQTVVGLTGGVGGEVFKFSDGCATVTLPDAIIGVKDFTVEFWAYPTDISGVKILYENRQAGTQGFVLYTQNNYLIFSAMIGGTPNLTSLQVPFIYFNWDANNTFHFIQISRIAGIVNLIVNGVAYQTVDFSTVNFGVAKLELGGSTFDPQPFSGYINNFRLTVGEAQPNVVPSLPFLRL